MRELLRHNISTEIAIWNDTGGTDLSTEQVHQLAGLVVAEVDYAFSIDWDPNWVPSGKLHTWIEGDAHFARCPECLVDSPASAALRNAIAWVERHRTSH